MRKLLKPLHLLAVCAVAATPVAAEAQAWAHWTLPEACGDFTNVTSTLGAGSVTFATTAGAFYGVQNDAGGRCGGPITETGGQGANFFNPTAPYNPLPDNISFVQINGSLTGKITFSQAVINPYIALISVGQGGTPVEYDFQNPFTVLSHNTANAAYWGAGTYTLPAGDILRGVEFSGVLQFEGTFTEIEFSTNPSENWHGFTVGALRPEVGTFGVVAPEPSTYALMAAGLAGLGFAARRRRIV